jgi:hypothetical protein
VYFDVLGMAVTSGAQFNSFFASGHVSAFADVLQVESSSQKSPVAQLMRCKM